MLKLKVLTAAFFIALMSSFFFIGNTALFSGTILLSDSILAIGLYIFLLNHTTKKVGKIRIESTHYPFTYVLKSYAKPKNVWAVFDYKMKKFRPVEWGHVPLMSFALIVLGSFLIYTSYLIVFTLGQVMFLFVFRSLILFLFLVMGMYTLFMGLYRFFSVNNEKAKKVAKFLNGSRFLINAIQAGRMYVQVTPNFHLKQGFVDSVEFVMCDKGEDIKRLEKILADTTSLINRL